jgi:hypothetical protein
MKLAFALILAATPVLAQEAPATPEAEAEENGFSLMEEGAKLLFRGFMTEAEPAIAEMSQALEEMAPVLEGLGDEIGPKITELFALVDDFTNYDMPVVLPNGDILIRRNAPLTPGITPNAAPEAPPQAQPDPQADPAPGPNGEIEL